MTGCIHNVDQRIQNVISEMSAFVGLITASEGHGYILFIFQSICSNFGK
jgi:hypothetical protein